MHIYKKNYNDVRSSASFAFLTFIYTEKVYYLLAKLSRRKNIIIVFNHFISFQPKGNRHGSTISYHFWLPLSIV